MNKNIKNNFKKGFVEMMILSLLKNRDLYGYEMVKLIIDCCDGYLSVPEGSLYPTLYKLEDKKLISSYKKTVGKRMIKTYYHLEADGRDYLNEIIPEFYKTIDAVKKVVEYTEL